MIRIDGFPEMKDALESLCARFAAAATDDALFNLRMVAHELLTNALAYGGGEAYFSFALEGGEVRITVRGKEDFRPPEHTVCADVEAEHGRGLYLIDALSVRRAYSERDGVSVFVKLH